MGIEGRAKTVEPQRNKHLVAWYENKPMERMKRAQQGDKAAVTEIVTLIYPYVVATAKGIRRNRYEAADLAQEAMTRALERLGQFRNQTPGSFPDWMRQIIHNEVIRSRRKRLKIVPADPVAIKRLAESGYEIEEDVLDDLIDADRNQLLKEAIPELPTNQRTVIEALLNPETKDKPYTELAEFVGMPVGSIGAYLNRGAKRLRRAIREYY